MKNLAGAVRAVAAESGIDAAEVEQRLQFLKVSPRERGSSS
jgi:hypothetical protein